MRKILSALALVFALAFTLGAVAPGTAEAAGNCYYTCSCKGEPLYCCETSTGVSCKPTDDFQCPQIITC